MNRKVEMSWLAELPEKYRGQGFEVLCILTDNAPPAKVAALNPERRRPCSILMCNQKTAQAYGGIPDLPESFFIDRHGKIVAVMDGAHSKVQIEADIREAMRHKMRFRESMIVRCLTKRMLALPVILLLLALPLAAQQTPSPSHSLLSTSPVLEVHGGVDDAGPGQLSALDEASVRAGITRALTQGYAVLRNGGTSVDAVEAALRSFEDDTSGEFDAGRGAVVNTEGVAELDAAIIDGATLEAGSVAAVEHIAHPISLARLVMERTRHVMLVSDGAEKFAKAQGIELVPNSTFITPSRRQKYEQWKVQRTVSPSHRGTTGAVALDAHSNLAAGTTTGGTSWKLPGRVGDSPILGAGTYASNAFDCAVSSSGAGEFFMRDTIAVDICHRVAYLHQSLDQAAEYVIHTELTSQGGDGGVIVLNREGHFVAIFNTKAFWRGWIGADGVPHVELFE